MYQAHPNTPEQPSFIESLLVLKKYFLLKLSKINNVKIHLSNAHLKALNDYFTREKTHLHITIANNPSQREINKLTLLTINIDRIFIANVLL